MNFLLDIGAEGDNFYCDCPIGSRGHICKHFPGIRYNLSDNVQPEVQRNPLMPQLLSTIHHRRS